MFSMELLEGKYHFTALQLIQFRSEKSKIPNVSDLKRRGQKKDYTGTSGSVSRAPHAKPLVFRISKSL